MRDMPASRPLVKVDIPFATTPASPATAVVPATARVEVIPLPIWLINEPLDAFIADP
jgi:hypothetical protein